MMDFTIAGLPSIGKIYRRNAREIFQELRPQTMEDDYAKA
jgi:hypothetical protein